MPSSAAPGCPHIFYDSAQICPRRPEQKEIIRRQVAPASWESLPSEDRSEPPPLRAAVAGRKYRWTAAFHGHIGSSPIFAAGVDRSPHKRIVAHRRGGWH